MNDVKKTKSPHVFLLLIALVLLSSVLTYIVPAGSFERVVNEATEQTLVVPGSFSYTDQSPVAPWLLPVKFFETLISKSTATLIFFILIIGGAFEIIMQSSAITALSDWIIRHFRKRRAWVIPIFICMFSVFGFTMGLTTASIVFVPIGIAVAKALGYDAITGMAMVMLGTNAGFAAGIYNPFSVGIAQAIAELPMFSGAWLRWLLLIPLLTVTAVYILRKAKKSELTSQAADELWNEATQTTQSTPFTLRIGLVLASLFIALGIITYGVSVFNWSIPELAVVFLLLGIVCGIAAGFSANQICTVFIAGSKKMMTGVFIIGIAATMRTVLTQGGILDSITYTLIGAVEHLPSWAQLLGMFYANALLDPLITSGSAHASVAMPLMVPLADGLMLSRQSAVLAFQLGDGLVNLVSPISTTLTSCLAVSGIGYGKWTKYFFPLVGIYLGIGTVFMLLAGIIGY